MIPASRHPRHWRWRPSQWPLAVWIVAAVAAAHLLVFWAVADRGFLPKVRKVPPVPPPNFAAREQRRVDPETGETITEREFVVSTRLAPKDTPKR
jgi:hypothetical protein